MSEFKPMIHDGGIDVWLLKLCSSQQETTTLDIIKFIELSKLFKNVSLRFFFLIW